MLKQVARFVHTGQWYLAAEKSALATLRKKTGYTFANCKKALELHNNDLIKVFHEILKVLFKCINIIYFIRLKNGYVNKLNN